MNSRSSVNESNLVNFSDLPTRNQLDRKNSLLSFPFDHIYACHSVSADRRQPLQLDNEVEISAHRVADDRDLLVAAHPEIRQLRTKLTAAESHNKKLKNLTIYHLDLIQKQNELMTKREKVFQALKQENETLRSKLNRMDKKASVNPRQSVNTPPLLDVAPSTSAVVKKEPGTSPQIMFNNYPELLLPDNQTNSYIFNTDTNKPKSFGQESFDTARTTKSDVKSFLPSDLSAPSTSISDSNRNSDNFTMIENKRSYVKKEIKTESRPEPLYTVTTNSGNPVIQKIQRNKRRASGIGSLSRMSRNTTPKVEISEPNKLFDDDKSFDRNLSVNKKSKLINTYGKSKTTIPKKTTQFTGSLSDRLQLIDTTPTGEDPYQLGEADMREQSPIPKLMLQKSHSRMKLSGNNPSTATSTRRIYDPAIPETVTKPASKSKVDRYQPSSTFVPEPKKELPKTIMAGEPDLDLVKTEPDIDWQIFATGKPETETSLCDFSYGENSNNLATTILPGLDSVEFQDFFNPDSPLNLDTLNPVDFNPIPENNTGGDKSKRRGARTTSLLSPEVAGVSGLSELTDFASPVAVDTKRGTESKRGRKRAMSATGVTKKRETGSKQAASKPRAKGKAAGRGKKAPVPGMMTSKPYHTLMGDPDLTWYLGLDPDLKFEDIVPTDASKTSAAATVEVPRWREKPYTSCYTLEGTENLDDKVFEKRHHKLEAEERRQLRWHMRRVREQRHVERLRLRQRDSWCGGSASPAYQQPSIYTIWPQPQRDAHFIEITETLPVMAFGEILPALPESDFILPWVRTSKALKRANRSKTLH